MPMQNYQYVPAHGTLGGLGFNPCPFTSSITWGKSLNFAGPNVLICEIWEQIGLYSSIFQVPSKL